MQPTVLYYDLLCDTQDTTEDDRRACCTKFSKGLNSGKDIACGMQEAMTWSSYRFCNMCSGIGTCHRML